MSSLSSLRKSFPSSSVLVTATLTAALACAGTAQAIPTGNPIPGVTGLGVIPTTETVPSGSIQATLQYEYIDLNNSSGHVHLLPLATLNYGFKRGEIGGSYVRERSSVLGFSDSNSYFAAQAKYRLYEGSRGLAFAVGAHYYDFGSESGFDLGNVTSVYGTGSYLFRRNKGAGAPLGQLHAGLLYQYAHASGDSNSIIRPYIGAEYFLGSQFKFAADYLASDNGAAGAYTVAARYAPSNSPVSAQLGVGRLRSDTKYFASVSYAFGGKKGSDTSAMPESSISETPVMGDAPAEMPPTP